MDRRSRVVTALAAAAVAAGVTTACAEWQAQVARDRGVPFGTGEFDGEIVARSGLHVRAEPSTDASSVVILADKVSVRIICKERGETVEGNAKWYKLGNNRWVSARYVANVGAAPDWCE